MKKNIYIFSTTTRLIGFVIALLIASFAPIVAYFAGGFVLALLIGVLILNKFARK